MAQIATQQTQLHQALTALLQRLASESTQSDLAKQLEQLTLSFTRLSIQLTHSISLQQQISASLASLSQQPEDDLGF
jgi:CII-binding regulator of phage lambda lysogenization HflD